MPSLQFNIISNTLVFVLLTDAWLSEKFSYMYMDQVILETLSPVYQISQQCFNTDTTPALFKISPRLNYLVFQSFGEEFI